MENLNLMVGSEKFVFEKSVNMEWLEFNYGEMLNDWKDVFNGDGIYKIEFGSRGMIENIIKVSNGNELNYLDKEELIEFIESGYDYGDCFENEEDLREYLEEFVDSGVIKDGVVVGKNGELVNYEYVFESMNEEEENEYYWVRG